jgi:hypothetical protein
MIDIYWQLQWYLLDLEFYKFILEHLIKWGSIMYYRFMYFLYRTSIKQLQRGLNKRNPNQTLHLKQAQSERS